MKKIKTYGLLSVGAALFATGLTGLGKADMISFKLNKNRNLVIGIAGVIAFIGAALSAYILDAELYPETEEEEELEAISEN